MRPEEHTARMREIGNELIELMQAHDQTEHGGRVCHNERWNTLAFLAHALGFKAEAFDLARMRHAMALYEASCENCSHTRN